MAPVTDRQNDFLRAAIELVDQAGFHGLTIRKLAASVGVTEPAVYRHFPSKQALIQAMLERLQAAILPHFRRLRHRNGSTQEIFAGFFRDLYEEFRQTPAYAAFIFSEEVFHSEPAIKKYLFEVQNHNMAVLSASLAALQEAGWCRNDLKAADLSLVLVGCIRMSISRRHLNPKPNSQENDAKELAYTLSSLFDPVCSKKEKSPD
ncbi:MAG: TetR/AcrR family transcriptional regulator [Spirochaetales bacterium]|nr:TetR/AcrR family transcriptional regulator [Spirochaetales bacterium]MCF7937951.1 TetR/AcrR family transcriptional regulator [Spirochaetales bacterium]